MVSFLSVDASTSDFWRGVLYLGLEGAFAMVKVDMNRKLEKWSSENLNV